MLYGIGTDIIEIHRIAKAVENQHFLARVFTKAERVYCERRGQQRHASYAARFAGKEAILKAFGTGLRGGSLLDIEILPDALGCPQVSLSGCFARFVEEKCCGKIHLSLSHSREYATAQCVIEEESK